MTTARVEVYMPADSKTPKSVCSVDEVFRQCKTVSLDIEHGKEPDDPMKVRLPDSSPPFTVNPGETLTKLFNSGRVRIVFLHEAQATESRSTLFIPQ